MNGSNGIEMVDKLPEVESKDKDNVKDKEKEKPQTVGAFEVVSCPYIKEGI